ncbi:olfactory receptor 1f45-like [Pleurodeles waltl]|uniref:olfactory receptor 1f45-like n=1 Tax=Pleurodeles waltl TaxID=8319 RepID=UPI003709727B
MGLKNWTFTNEFILLGVSDQPWMQPWLFVIFLAMYVTTLLGNTTIICIIGSDCRLHTPMYFFLCNFSFVDICLTSVTVPKLLANILSEKKSIYFSGCVAQLFFFLLIGNMESFLLGVMAYDRYVAICNPLHYTTVMSRQVCLVLVVVSWITSALHSLIYSVMASRLSYCKSNILHHFFCDIPPLLKLSCSDTSMYELIIFTEGSIVVMGPFILITISYALIVFTLLKVSSEQGRWKAFSTCFSHLVVVTLFYGTDIFMYFRPSSSYSLDYDRVVSVMYTIVAPMLNPFIYSLRNKDVKDALKKPVYQSTFTIQRKATRM